MKALRDNKTLEANGFVILIIIAAVILSVVFVSFKTQDIPVIISWAVVIALPIIATGFKMNSIPELYVGKKEVHFVPLRDRGREEDQAEPEGNDCPIPRPRPPQRHV